MIADRIDRPMTEVDRKIASEGGRRRYVLLSHAAQGLTFLLVLMTIMVALLYGKPMSPAAATKFYVVSIPLPGPFRLLLNVDSPEFMRMANQPATLFEKDNGRQSRPAYIIAGY